MDYLQVAPPLGLLLPLASAGVTAVPQPDQDARGHQCGNGPVAHTLIGQIRGAPQSSGDRQ